MLRIGDFSKLSRISIRMLRHYDEIGLLKPQTTDAFTGYRFYSEEQLAIAGRISSLKEMGFGLNAIAELLKIYQDTEALKGILAVKRAEIKAEAEATHQRLLLLDTAIQRLRKDETAMEYNVVLKTIAERYVASVRQTIPSYAQEYLLWEYMKETTAQNVQPGDPYLGLAVFHDEGFKEGDVDVEIQATVKGTYQNTEHVVFKTEPAVEVASVTYKGSYEQLTSVNQAIANWVKDNGYTFFGAMFCIYHVSPAQTSNMEELVTEVCYPVKK